MEFFYLCSHHIYQWRIPCGWGFREFPPPQSVHKCHLARWKFRRNKYFQCHSVDADAQCKRTVTFLQTSSVAVPMGAPRHAPPPPPTEQNFLNFMHFLENLYVGAFPWRVGGPSYGESWIRPWSCTVMTQTTREE